LRVFPLGEALEIFIRREDAERFVEEVRGDDPEARELPADRRARAGGGWADLSLRRRQLRSMTVFTGAATPGLPRP